MPAHNKPRPVYQSGKVAGWVRAIKNGTSGVYWIYDAETGELLYIGESHSGRLRKTMLRHFQKWDGKTAGETYDPETVVVAYSIQKDEDALARQNELIEKHLPRDNDYPKPAQPKTRRKSALREFMENLNAAIEKSTPDPF